MKRIISMILLMTNLSSHLIADALEDFNVIITPQWQDLESNEEKAKQFGGKWILAGSINFKKKAKDTVHLNRIYLEWKGSPIEHLTASLYKCESDKEFLPIQENLVCDGIWNKAHQTLMLNFDKKETLGFSNTFNLVLTVPEDLENTLKKGAFSLMSTYLPEPFKLCAHKQSLSLTFSVPPPQFNKSIKVAAHKK